MVMEQVCAEGLTEWEVCLLHHQDPSGCLPDMLIGNPALLCLSMAALSQGLRFNHKKTTDWRRGGRSLWPVATLPSDPDSAHSAGNQPHKPCTLSPWVTGHNNTALCALWGIGVHYLSRTSLWFLLYATMSLMTKAVNSIYKALHLVPTNFSNLYLAQKNQSNIFHHQQPSNTWVCKAQLHSSLLPKDLRWSQYISYCNQIKTYPNS